jgi:tetratricopeptide (TPR) repeat protein
LHPDLQVTRVSSARVATFRGLLWEAVAHYEQAWSLGSPRVTLAVDLIALLNELGQTDRAQRYVDDVRHFMQASEEMIDRSLVDFVYDTDVDAIRFAEAWVRSHQNSEGYMRYGRTLALAAIPGSPHEAERLELARVAFEKAVELNPNDIRAWGAYYRFYAAARPNPAKAQEVLDQLANHKSISELDRTFGLAQLKESIGQLDAAAESYAASIEQLDATVDELSHLVVYERAAQFYSNYDPEKAAECSRRALEIDPASAGARTVLIDVLLGRRTAGAIDEADRLFTASTDDRNLSDDERRLRATILQARAAVDAESEGDLHTQAVATLRTISRPTTNDNLMVAESLLLSGTPAAAANQLTLTAAAHDLNVLALVRFLRANETIPRKYVEFESVFEQAFLRIEETPGYEIEALKLRLSSLRAIDSHKSGNELNNLDSLMIDQLTQRCLVRMESAQQRETFMLALFDFLLQSERIDDAARLTKMALPPESPLHWATTFALALAANASRCEITNEAENVLENVVRVHKDDPKLNFAMGNLRYMQGLNAESISRFRHALAKNPDHVMTLNNLALALAATSDVDLGESLALIKRAIELSGRTPILLDSLALLQMQNGEPQAAISTINEALADVDVSATWLIHLASAWQQTGDRRQAERIFALIDHANLANETLTPEDLKMYATLNREFSN